VTDHDNCGSLSFHLVDLVNTFSLKLLIAYRQDLIHDQHIWLDMNGNAKPQPHIHAGRIMFDWHVNEFAQFGKGHNIFVTIGDVTPIQAQHGRIEVNVLPAGQVRMETSAKLQQRAYATTNHHPSRIGSENSGHQFQDGAFTTSIPADDAQGLSWEHLKTDISYGDQLFPLTPAVTPGEESDQRIHHRSRSVRRKREPFAHILKTDNWLNLHQIANTLIVSAKS